jgi:DNA-binding MarR family transcriptional regulator
MEQTTTKRETLAQDFLESLYYHIKLTEKYCKLLAKQVEHNFSLPITLDELTALGIIKMYKGTIHQRDLAKIILKDRANTGKMLTNLESHGYIKRHEITKNKRLANALDITQKGLDIIDTMQYKVKPVFDEITNKVSAEELQSTKDFLTKYRNIMKEAIEIDI